MLIFQISDAHFSNSLGSFAQGFPKRQEGHSFDLCLKLKNAIGRIAAEKGKVDYYVIDSGDISRTGTEGEFRVYEKFIRSTEPPCLNVPNKRHLFVAGNHDHWKGKTNWPFNSFDPSIYSFFRSTPFSKVLNSNECPAVEVYGVDSSSGLSSKTRTARGEISHKQFDRLEKLLVASCKACLGEDQEVIRIAICHHDLSKVRKKRRWHFHAFPLSRRSRIRLLDLCATYKVSGVFTGHFHYFDHKKFRRKVTPFGGTQEDTVPVFEFRSPTTLQGGESLDLRNGFWIHEFKRIDGVITWIPELYILSGDRFMPSQQLFSPIYLN